MLDNFRFHYPIRVRYSEIDGQKIVFNAHYSTYVDVASTEYFREVIGANWMELAETNTFDIVLAKITLEYHQPAKLDDLLHVYCRVKRIGKSSLTCSYVIAREGTNDILVTADAIQVSYNNEKGKSQPIPEDIIHKIKEYEGIKLETV
ncbi:acyl-CoA thioesterase [Alkalihalobacterium alkalinitrilicum]|uniref:acyl-CoA thioesterase n=1 Tax=Alkalihalobacterium alkalinitrilicum TaxID=427920 RepID=UPI0009954B70|nr:thioesterase family protein [Alkalihalobacterium alkalinitrilicum]